MSTYVIGEIVSCAHDCRHFSFERGEGEICGLNGKHIPSPPPGYTFGVPEWCPMCKMEEDDGT